MLSPGNETLSILADKLKFFLDPVDFFLHHGGGYQKSIYVL